MFGRSTIIYGGSLLVHAGVALSVAAIAPPPPRAEPTRITLREVKRPAEKKAPEPPPPAPPAPAPEVAAPARPRPAKKAPEPSAAPVAAAAAPAAVSGAAPSFGITLSGGSASGGGGIAVAAPSANPVAPVTKTAAPKTLTRAKPIESACLDAPIKPKPLRVPQPVYAQQAREAGVAGKVRVELKVDAAGRVVSARVLEGLGHGLDDAALEAARNAEFEPASQCGKAIEMTFVIGMRFGL